MSKIAVGFRIPETIFVSLVKLSRLEGTNLSKQLNNAVDLYVQEKSKN